MLEDEFIIYTREDDNDSDMDEYTCAVQFTSTNFSRLVECYNKTEIKPLHGEFSKPFDMTNSDSRLDFVVWLAAVINTHAR